MARGVPTKSSQTKKAAKPQGLKSRKGPLKATSKGLNSKVVKESKPMKHVDKVRNRLQSFRKARSAKGKKRGAGPVAKRNEHTIILKGCPLEMTTTHVHQQFPDAKFVKMVKKDNKFHGICFVGFPDEDGALEAASSSVVTIMEQEVAVSSAAPAPKDTQDLDARTVVLRGCPLTTTEEAVRKLFPTAKRVNLVATGGEFRGVCFVRFPSKADASKAIEEGPVSLGGKSVQACLVIPKEDFHSESEARTIIIKGCPLTATAADFQKEFPSAAKVNLVQKNAKPTGTCFVIFTDPPEAEAATKQSIVVQGKQLFARMASGTKEDWQRGLDSRTVVIKCAPKGTDKAALKTHFPKAERLNMARGVFFARFPTDQEAREAANQKVQIRGTTLIMCLAAEPKGRSGKRTRADEGFVAEKPLANEKASKKRKV